MDKDWLSEPRFSIEYQNGAKKFIEIAMANARNPDRISCPCKVCKNFRHQRPDIVYEHLVIKGMDPTYTAWVLHGEKSSRVVENRKKQTYVHVTSRKGFARLEHELRMNTEDPSKITRVDVWIHGYTKKGKTNNPEVSRYLEQIEEFTQSQEGQSQTGLHDDAIAHVLGPEHPGRVRGLGFGVTPSKVHASVGYNRGNKLILEEMNQMRQQMNQMQAMMATLVSQTQAQGGHAQDSPASINRQSGQPVDPSRNLVGANCTLLNWTTDEGEDVALGSIASTDPKCKVHHVPLGRHCYKVWVNEVIVNNVSLFRPTREAFTLDDAIETPIAWPIESIRIHD